MIAIIMEMDEVQDGDFMISMVWGEVMAVAIADQMGEMRDVAKSETVKLFLMSVQVIIEMAIVGVKVCLVFVPPSRKNSNNGGNGTSRGRGSNNVSSSSREIGEGEVQWRLAQVSVRN